MSGPSAANPLQAAARKQERGVLLDRCAVPSLRGQRQALPASSSTSSGSTPAATSADFEGDACAIVSPASRGSGSDCDLGFAVAPRASAPMPATRPPRHPGGSSGGSNITSRRQSANCGAASSPALPPSPPPGLSVYIPPTGFSYDPPSGGAFSPLSLDYPINIAGGAGSPSSAQERTGRHFSQLRWYRSIGSSNSISADYLSPNAAATTAAGEEPFAWLSINSTERLLQHHERALEGHYASNDPDTNSGFAAVEGHPSEDGDDDDAEADELGRLLVAAVRAALSDASRTSPAGNLPPVVWHSFVRGAAEGVASAVCNALERELSLSQRVLGIPGQQEQQRHQQTDGSVQHAANGSFSTVSSPVASPRLPRFVEWEHATAARQSPPPQPQPSVAAAATTAVPRPGRRGKGRGRSCSSSGELQDDAKSSSRVGCSGGGGRPPPAAGQVELLIDIADPRERSTFAVNRFDPSARGRLQRTASVAGSGSPVLRSAPPGTSAARKSLASGLLAVKLPSFSAQGASRNNISTGVGGGGNNHNSRRGAPDGCARGGATPDRTPLLAANAAAAVAAAGGRFEDAKAASVFSMSSLMRNSDGDAAGSCAEQERGEPACVEPPTLPAEAELNGDKAPQRQLPPRRRHPSAMELPLPTTSAGVAASPESTISITEGSADGHARGGHYPGDTQRESTTTRAPSSPECGWLGWQRRSSEFFATTAQLVAVARLRFLEKVKNAHVLLVLLLMLFSFIAVPLRIGIGSQRFATWFMWLELAVDVALIVLAIVDVRLPFNDRGHEVVLNASAARSAYFSTRLPRDAASLFPLQLLIFPLHFAELVGSRALDFARINRMLLAFSFSHQYDEAAERWLASFHPLVHRLVKFLLIFFCYVFATATPVMLVFRADVDVGRQWLHIRHADDDFVDFGAVLLHTLGITAGRSFPLPVTETQIVVMIFICLMGMGSMAVIITGVTSMVLSLVERSSRLTTKLQDVQVQLEHMRVSPAITDEIIEYYATMFRLYNTFSYDASADDVLDELPNDVREAVDEHVHADIVRSVSLFRHVVDPEMIRAIALRLEMFVVMPGTAIAIEGDEGFDMFFVARGTARASSGQFPELDGDLGPGDFFGQGSLLFGTPQHLTVVTKTVTQVFALSKENFEALLQRFPDLLEPVVQSVAHIAQLAAVEGSKRGPVFVVGEDKGDEVPRSDGEDEQRDASARRRRVGRQPSFVLSLSEGARPALRRRDKDLLSIPALRVSPGCRGCGGSGELNLSLASQSAARGLKHSQKQQQPPLDDEERSGRDGGGVGAASALWPPAAVSWADLSSLRAAIARISRSSNRSFIVSPRGGGSCSGSQSGSWQPSPIARQRPAVSLLPACDTPDEKELQQKGHQQQQREGDDVGKPEFSAEFAVDQKGSGNSPDDARDGGVLDDEAGGGMPLPSLPRILVASPVLNRESTEQYASPMLSSPERTNQPVADADAVAAEAEAAEGIGEEGGSVALRAQPFPTQQPQDADSARTFSIS